MSRTILSSICSIHGDRKKVSMSGIAKPARVVARGDSYQLYYYNPDGHRRRLSVGPDEAQARRMAVKFSDWILEGKDPEFEISKVTTKEAARRLTLKEFFPVFMDRHGKKQSINTQRLYKLFYRNICRCTELANCRLSEVDKELVVRYGEARMKNDKVKPATVNREATFIKNMLQRALEYDKIDRNPLDGLRKLKEGNRRDVSNISPEMISSLLGVFIEPMASIVKFAVYSGFRKENILSLTISQIVFYDLKPTGEIRHVVKGGRYRVDPLGKQAVAILKKIIGNRESGYVFINPDTGDRYTSIHNTFDRAVRKQNLRIATGQKICFHDLRRLCGTWLLQSGRSLDEVREVLGHKDRSTTDRYAKLKVSGDVFDSMPVLR